jgi:O-antigen/teichoic acid export membrane protein
MNFRSGFIYLTITNILFIFVGYVTNIFLARHFGPAEYGVYGVLTALMTAINILHVSGIPQAVSRFIAHSKNKENEILASGIRLQLTIATSASLLLFLCAPLIANLFNDANFTNYMRLMSLIFPVYGLYGLYSGYYNGLHNFKKQALMNTVYIVSKLVLIIIFAIMFGIPGVIIGFILSPLVALIIGIKLPNSSKLYSYKKIILYSIPLIAFAGFSTLQLSLDIFSLKALTNSPSITGYYTAAQSIAIIPYFAISALGVVIMPSISSYIGKDQINEATAIVSRSVRFFIILIAPVVILMLVSSKFLIVFIFGENYLPAITSFRILLIGYALLSLFALMANVLNGAGYAKSSLMCAIAGLCASLFSYLLLIPKYGATGAAFGTLIGASLAALFTLINVYKYFRFKISILTLGKVFIASACLAFGLKINIENIYIASIYYLIALILYICLLRIMKEFSDYEYSVLKNIVSGKSIRFRRYK